MACLLADGLLELVEVAVEHADVPYLEAAGVEGLEQFFGAFTQFAAVHAAALCTAVSGFDEFGGVLAEVVTLAGVEGALVERLVKIALKLVGGGLHGCHGAGEQRQRCGKQSGEQYG